MKFSILRLRLVAVFCAFTSLALLVSCTRTSTQFGGRTALASSSSPGGAISILAAQSTTSSGVGIGIPLGSCDGFVVSISVSHVAFVAALSQSGNAQFYSDAECTSSISGLGFTSSDSVLAFYLKDSIAETTTVTVSTSQYGSASFSAEVINVAAPSPSPSTAPSSNYVGCYTDTSTRALPNELATGGATVESCVSAAADAGYAYAGLQYGGQCFAGNSLGYTLSASSNCNDPCNANANEMCGGYYFNSIYSTGATIPGPSPSPSPSPSVTSAPTSNYIGCYTDTAARALPDELVGSGATVESCTSAAAGAGYAYAGLQYGGQCFAGNSLGYALSAESNCNMPCTANPAEMCGGDWFNSIYSTGAAPTPSPSPTSSPTPTPSPTATPQPTSTPSSTPAGTSVFSCSSFSSAGACGAQVYGSNYSFNLNTGAALSGSQILLAPADPEHASHTLVYITPVNVQAFTASFTFVPNGVNVAFTLNNTNNVPGYEGANFTAGAGCESGFYQAFTPPEPNNVFALELDSNSPLVLGGSFTYSSAQIYQANQSPCIPPWNNDPTPSKISTYPVPLNYPANVANTTTGDVYSATITYDGSNLTLNMYDITAGGSCPGASCFTNTWNGVNIPAWVGGNTAYVGLNEGTNSNAVGALYINSFSYSQ